MQKPPKMRVVVAVGGSGGHLFPSQAFAKEVESDLDLMFIGSGLSTNVYFQKEFFTHSDVSSDSPRGRNILKALISLFKGTLRSIQLLRAYKPSMVMGFGSYHSFPVMLAARLLRIPYALYESNAIPGRVIRLLSKKALFTGLYFESAFSLIQGKKQLIAMPKFYDTHMGAEESKKAYGFNPDLPVILVFGGSQGAHFLNELVSLVSKKFEKNWQVLHFVGKKDDPEMISMRYQEAGITAHVKAFESQMARAWSCANMAICRSGASTIAEIIHYNVPSLLVPYPYASENHQVANAKSLKHSSSALMLEEKELTEDALLSGIQEVLIEKNKEMKASLKVLQLQSRDSLAKKLLSHLKGDL